MAPQCFVPAVFSPTVQMYGGMRGIKALVTETSLLDPEEVRQSSEFTGYFDSSSTTTHT